MEELADEIKAKKKQIADYIVLTGKTENQLLFEKDEGLKFLMKKEEFLMNKEEFLMKKEEFLMKKEEQLREERLILLRQREGI